MKQLILGGARSGKSSLAEQLAETYGDNIAYIATANPAFNDDEMAVRIAKHKQQRPSHWQSIESPITLADTLKRLTNVDCILVDCLTLWLSNCLFEANWPEQRQALLDSLKNFSGNLIMVSNEVGMGVVPLGEISRQFVDESGFLHQAVAKHCDRVIFTAAGLPLVMKGPALSS